MTTTKDFGPIRDDYTFFEKHSTEAEQALETYLPGFRDVMTRRLGSRAPLAVDSSSSRCRMLDFGCGPGTFSTKLMEALACPAEQFVLTLVEPQSSYLEEAATALTRFSTSPLQCSPSLPTAAIGSFDLILANHVFYYVPHLDDVIPSIVASLAPGGIFQTAISGNDNVLIQFWTRAFAMLGRSVPYHTAESVATVFADHGIPAVTTTGWYRLAFPDSDDNRSRILRFLFGEFYSLLPLAEVRRFFDPYATDGAVTIDTVQTHYVVSG